MAIITGTGSNDILNGTSQADELYGLDGDDALSGGGGADRLVGGLGADTLTGGASADIYVFTSVADSTAGARDIITDFVSADRIDLTTLAPSPLIWSGTTPRAWGVWYTQSGGNTFVSADTTGDGAEDFSLQLNGTIALAATHFIGINQAPDLRSTSGDTIARTVTETNAGLTTTGTLTVTDPDSAQTVSVAVVATSFSGTPEAVAAVQAAASGWMSVTAGALAAETADRKNVTWTFNSGDEAFNFLKNGQSLQIIYTIEATDSNVPGSGKDTQTVTITINGRNDGPQIVVGGGDSTGTTVVEGAASLVASGTLGVVDPDQFDTFTGSVYAVATSGPTGSLSAATLRGYLTVGISPGATSPQTTASLGWDFNPGAQAFDFLGEGETLTLSYTVRATDSAGAIGSSVVTIVVQGQNDAAVLAGSATRAYTENAAAVSIYNNGTLTLTDIDDTVFPSAQVSITGNFRAGQDVLSFTNTSATTYGDIGATYNETTGVLSLESASGTATRAQWQSALRNVRYANTSDGPDTAARTISFQINDGGSVNGQSNIATSTVTITATNDAPQIFADAGDVASAGVQEGASGLTASGVLSIVDPDQLDLLTPSVYAVSTTGPAGGISATTLRSFLSVAAVLDSTSPQTTASLGWTFDSDSQAFNHLAEGQTLTLTYTVRATDATGAFGSHLVTIVIQGQNDAPVLAGAGTRAYTENAAPQVVHSTITLTDIDDTTFVSAQVSITDGSHAGQDVLSFTNTSATTYGNIQATYDAGTGVLSLVSEDGSATLGQWQSALRNVRYANTSNAPDTTARTINFQINDGGSVNGQSNIATSTVTIAAVNDAPLILAAANATVTEGAADLVASGTLSVVDPDQLDSLAASVYAVSTTGPTGGIPAATLRSFLSVAAVLDSTSPQTTASLGWDFNPGAQAFDFLGEGETLTLSYTVRATDSAGAIGSSVVTIVVQGQNDAAVLAGSATRAYTENAAAVSIYNNGTLTLTDIDDTVFPSAQVSITGNFRAGQDVLSFTNTSATTYGDIGATYNETTGVLSLESASGTATRAQWQSALRNVRYANTSDGPDTAARTISFQINDGGSVNGQSNIATSTVTITATNDAPVVTFPVTLTAIPHDSPPRLITQAELLANASDGDGPSLSAQNLQIAAGSLGTLVDNNDGTWTYTRAAGDSSQVNFTYDVSDGALSVATAASLDILPNDAPVLAGSAFVMNAGDGIVTTDVGGADWGRSVALQPDGKIVMAGYRIVSGNADFALVRYNADGTLDTGFGGGGSVTSHWNNDDQVFSVALQSDGKIVVAGRSSSGIAVARYNTDGSLDTSFSGTGFVTTPVGSGAAFGFGVTLQADGGILVAGYGSVSGNTDFALVRYLANGTLDGTFGGGTGIVTTLVGGGDIAYSVALQPDGKIVVAGSSNNGINDDIALVRYLADGTLDTSFGVSGIVTVNIGGADTGYSVAVQPDGRIVVAGYGNGGLALLRYTEDGSLDPTFGANGNGLVTNSVGSSAGYNLALQSDGKIVVAAYSGSSVALVRYNSSGTLDTSFGVNGTATTLVGSGGDRYSVAVQPDGRIVVAGHSTGTVDTNFVLLRYNANGTLDTSFDGLNIVTEDTAFSFSLPAGRFVDPNGDALVITAALADGTALPGWLTFNPATRTFSGTAPAGGPDLALRVTATDPGGLSVSDIIVLHTNSAPVAADAPASTNEDVQLNGTLPAATDVDGDAVTYTLGDDATNGTAVVNPDGSYTYTPDQDFNGSDSFSYIITDGHGGSNTYTVNVSVSPVNDAAVIGGALAGAVSEDDALSASGALTITDVDAGEAAVVAQTSAAGVYGVFSTDTAGAWTYQLNNPAGNVQSLAQGQSVTDTFTVTSADGSATQQVVITVSGANDAAEISGAVAGAVSEDGTLSASGALTITDVDASEAAVVAQTDTIGVYGVFSTDTAGAWTYQLNNAAGNVQSLAQGQSVTDTFTVTSADGSATQQVVITVSGANDPASIGGVSTGAVTVDGGTTANGAVTVSDVDAGEAALVPQTSTAGIYGVFSATAAGAWTYQLDNAAENVQALARGQSVTDVFTVASVDGTATQQVVITVNGTNDAPVLAGAAFVMNAGDGIVTTDVGGADWGRSVALQPDGKIVMAGYRIVSGNADFALVRYNADGTLDTGFGGGDGIVTNHWFNNDQAFSVALQSDGKIVVAGNSNFDFAVARYNTDGSLDTNFSGTGFVTTPVGSSGADFSFGVTLQADGRILVAGYGSGGSNTDFALMRYLANGTLDGTFGGGDGIATTPVGSGVDIAYSVALQSDGKIVVVGSSSNGSNDDIALVRYLADGTLDGTFGGGDGIVTANIGGADTGYSVAVQPDGKIVVAGRGNSGLVLLRYNTDGSLDTSFSGDGLVTQSVGGNSGYNLALQSDGKIVVAAYSGSSVALVRYNSSGTLDTSFGVNGTATTLVGSGGDRYSVAVQPDGRIVVAGHSTGTVDTNFVLLRYNANGTLDTSFDGLNIVTEDTAFSFSLPAGRFVDPNGDALVITAALADGTALPGWLTFNPATRTFSGTAPAGGPDLALRVTATDPGGLSVSDIVVLHTNTAPVATDRSASVDEDGVFIGSTIQGTDADGDALTYSLSTVAQHGVAYVNTNGGYGYTPAPNYSGSDSFGFTVTDGHGGSNSYVVNMTVTPVNDAAIIGGDVAGSVTEDGGAAAVVASGQLTITDVDSPATFVAQTGFAGEYGTFNVDSAGAWTYSLDNGNADVQNLDALQTLTDAFTVLGADGTPKVVTITINGLTDVVGAVSDGPLVGAHVFIDLNDSGVIDAGDEDVATTGANGSFSFNTAQNVGGHQLLAGGGTDTLTGEANTLTLGAPAGFSQINPITTLIQALVDSSEAVDVADAIEQVEAAFGLTPGAIDFATTDLYATGPDPAALLLAQRAAAIIATAAVIVQDAGAAPYAQDPFGSLAGDVAGAAPGDGTDALAGVVGVAAPGAQASFVATAAAINAATTAEEIGEAQNDGYFNDAPHVAGVAGQVAVPDAILRQIHGVVTTSVSPGAGADQANGGVVVQSDGKLVVAGFAQPAVAGTGQDFSVVRYNTDGSLDTTFGTGGKVVLPFVVGFSGTDGARGIALDGNDRIVVAGFAATAANGQDVALARLNTNGTLDTNFNPTGATPGIATLAVGLSTTNDVITSVAVQEDGKIVTAGYTASLPGAPQDFLLVRHNADGTLDTTFGGGGIVTTNIDADLGQDIAQGLTLQSDGKILAVGWTYATYGTTTPDDTRTNDIALVRYNSDGSLDSTFGAFVSGNSGPHTGIATLNISSVLGNSLSENGRSATVLSDGKILVGGWAIVGSNGPEFALLRFNANGSPDTSFGGNNTGSVTTSIGPGIGADQAYSMVVQPDGRILLVGYAEMGAALNAGGSDIALVRYTADGELDTTFGGDGKVTTAVGPDYTADQGFGIALQSDGRIVVTGFSGFGNTETVVLRYNADGSPDNTFNTNVVVQRGAAFSYSIPPGWFADADGDALTISAALLDGSTNLGWIGYDAADQRFFGTAATGVLDTVVRVTATDPQGASASILVSIRVNDGPPNVSQPSTGANIFNEDTVRVGSFAQNDPEGDSVRFALTPTIAPQHGTVVILANGIYQYTPFANYNGSDSFSVTGTDGYGLTAAYAANFTINPVNDAPVAVDDTAGTDEDTPVTINVLGNDADVDNLPATPNAGLTIKAGSVSVVEGSAAGTAQIVGNQIQFTPAANFNGTATINYVTTDGALDSAQATVTVTVAPVNDAPVAVNDEVTTDEDTPVTINVLGNDTDVDNLPATPNAGLTIKAGSVSVVEGSAAGTAQIVGNQIQFTPAANFYGTATINYVTTDGTLDSAQATVTVTVTPVNDAPYFDGGSGEPAEPAVGIFGIDSLEGVTITSLGAGSDFGFEVVVQADGKLLVIGQTTTDHGLDIALLRYYPSGQLDTTFGTGGKVVLPIDPGTGADVGRGIALQSDGRIVVVGSTTGASGSDVALLRFNTNGSLDTSFGTGGIVTQSMGLADDAGVAVNVLSDGNILVSGYSATAETGQDFALLRFDTTGSLDTTFGGGAGYAVTPIDLGAGNEAVLATAVQSDGKIITVGTTTSADGTTSDMALVRYNANGTLDATFGGDGIVVQSMSSLAGALAEGGRAVAVLPDGKILVGGWIASSGTGPDLALVRFNSDGSLDTDFGTGGAVTATVWNPPTSRVDRAFDMLVQPDGKIVVTGVTDRGLSTGLDLVLARFTASGALDVGNFGGNGDSGISVMDIGRGAITDGGFGVTLQPDGRILVVGWTGAAGSEDIVLASFGSDGEEDENFNNTLVINQDVDFGVTIPPGFFVDPEGDPLTYSVTLADGSPLPGWLHFNPVTLRIDGRAPVGASDPVIRITATDSPGGLSASYLITIRVNEGPTAAGATLSTTEDTPLVGILPTAVDAEGDEIVYSLVTPAAHGIVKVSANGTYTYTPDFNFNGSDSFSYSVTDYIDGEQGLSNTYTVTVDVTPVEDAPFFQDPSDVEEGPDTSIGILVGDRGAVTTAVGPAQATDAPNYAILQPDGKILVVGSATMTGTNLDHALVRYNPNGTLDTTFGGDGIVTLPMGPISANADAAQTVVVQQGGKILVLGAAFVGANNTNRDVVLLRLNPDGSYDTTFGGDDGWVVTPALPGSIDEQPFSLLVRPDGRIVVTGFATMATGNQDLLLASYTADGTALDSTFGTNGSGAVTTPIGSLNEDSRRSVLLSDGSIVVVGWTTVGASNSSAAGDIVLARYTPAGVLDSDFGNGGITITSLNDATSGALEQGRQLAVLDDGRILVGGLTTGTDGTGANFVLLRYTADGTLDVANAPDPGFGGGDGFTTLSFSSGNGTDWGFDMAVLPNGQILMAGQAAGNGADFALARFDADGSIDDTFGEDGTGFVKESIGQGTASDTAFRLLVQPDGRILLVGTAATQTGGSDFALMRFNADGTKDGTFGTTLVVNDNTYIQFTIPEYMVVDPEGDAMTFTALLANGDPLSAAGLTFDDETLQFSGTALSAGDVQIRLTATDSHGLSSTWPITLHVNHAPSTPAVFVNANEDLGFNSNLAVTPQDVDRDLVTYAITTGPSHGTAAIDSAGNYNYTPEADFYGPDSFTYAVTDYFGVQSSNTVTVNVVQTSAITDLLWQNTFTGGNFLPATNTTIATLSATGAVGTVTWSLVSGSGVAVAPNGTVTAAVSMVQNTRYSFIVQALDSTGPSRQETFDITTGSTGSDPNLPVTGANAISLAGDDTIMGHSGNDNIFGGPGNDTLMGQDGADALLGDAGNDWLYGGNGVDTFVFQDGFGADVITDFVSGTDKIHLTGVTNPDWTSAEVLAHASDINGGALIDFGDGNTIFLVGRAVTSLFETDFILQ